MHIDVYFDCSSPWTYLAFHNIQPLTAELEVGIGWKPILVGGIFNSVNPSVYHTRENPVPAKQRYMAKDLADWAHHGGLQIIWPPTVFPVNSVKAMRGCIAAAERDRLVPFARATFEAYWGADEDISRDDVLTRICERAGIDAAWLSRRIAEPEVKDHLRRNTEELVARGGFGSPTIFVGEDMYFGNDRLPLVRAALERRLKAA